MLGPVDPAGLCWCCSTVGRVAGTPAAFMYHPERRMTPAVDSFSRAAPLYPVLSSYLPAQTACGSSVQSLSCRKRKSRLPRSSLQSSASAYVTRSSRLGLIVASPMFLPLASHQPARASEWVVAHASPRSWKTSGFEVDQCGAILGSQWSIDVL
ncbi:hypothetical protein BD289DRAFT_423031 [Coniella lustricola]|uniref:Uncharacterized protein n=1 Tax=Coniella lustricola TaxID=2025994 RepID=A0A2T3AKA9_9PEZI|nr:hypothetical protein BD289DRAFT_423031 [Coniella lustricola]